MPNAQREGIQRFESVLILNRTRMLCPRHGHLATVVGYTIRGHVLSCGCVRHSDIRASAEPVPAQSLERWREMESLCKPKKGYDSQSSEREIPGGGRRSRTKPAEETGEDSL